MDFSIKLEGLEPAEEQQQAPVISAPVRSPSLNFDKPIAGLERDTVLPEIVAEDALRTNPQQFKQQKDLARKTGLPVDVVASDDGSLANSIRAKEMVAKLSAVPAAQKWFGVPENAKAAHQDTDYLVNAGKLAVGLYQAQDAAVDWTSNVVRGAGEGFFSNIVGGFTRQTGTIADSLADYLEKNVVDLGRIEYNFTGSGPMVRWRPSTDEDIEQKSPLIKYAKDFEDAKLGYKPGVTWDDFLEAPAALWIPYAIETGLVSLPDMVATLTNLPAYIAARSGSIGQKRAENDKRADATAGDILNAMPYAISTALLEKIGAKGVFGLADDALKGVGKKAVAKAAVKGAVKEGITEGIQEPIEYAGESLGTLKGFKVDEAIQRSLQGIVVGTGFGGSIRTGTAIAESQTKARQARERAEGFRELNATESALRDTDPEAWADFQSSMMEDAGVDGVRLSEEGAELLMQEMEAFPEQLKLDLTPSLSGKMDASSGTSLSPQQFWKLPKETIDKLAEHVSFDVNQMSAVEAEEVSSLTELMSSEGFMAEVAAELASVEIDTDLFVEIEQSIMQTGGALTADPAAARAAAQQMAAVFTTMAKRTGVPLQKIKDRFLPRIEGATGQPAADGLTQEGGFAAYRNIVDPEGRTIPAEDRPNLRMGDMYGMLPKDAEVVGELDDVILHRGANGDYYATAYNADLGEQDVVGYIQGRENGTELAVVEEMQGKGIGSELQYLFRRENPLAPTGGLTEAGASRLESTYDRLAAEYMDPLEQSAINSAEIELSKGFKDERIPELEEAARQRSAGEITQAEYDAKVNDLKPIRPYTSVPTPATVEEMRSALKQGQQGRVGQGSQFVGEDVGMRLDIPAYTNHGTWVPTMHNPAGKPIAHEAAAQISDVVFTQPGDSAERKAARVGTGEVSKSPFAQMNGTLQSVDPDQLAARAAEVINDPEWTQVGYDPRRHTFFYDRATQQPVLSADEVIQVGPLVLAKNAQFGSGQSFLFQDAPDGALEQARATVQDPEALGLTAEEAAQINPIYRPEAMPTKRLGTNEKAAKWLEDQFDGDAIIDFTEVLSEEQINQLGRLMAAEAQLALESTGNAADWYSEAVLRAMGVASIKYPMLQDDTAAEEAGFGTASNARFAFTYIMAVTSQNLDVAANSVAADTAFSEMVESIKSGDYSMKKEWGTGDKQAAMGKNFAKFLPMLNAMNGDTPQEQLTNLDKMFRKKRTVREWEVAMKAAGIPYSPPGNTAKDAVVYGSSTLGPKIGNGFWQNLNGNFDPLTIDLWMRRTWGRLTGKSIGQPDAVPAQRSRLKAAILKSRSNEQGSPDLIEMARSDLASSEAALEAHKSAGQLEGQTKKDFSAETRRLNKEVSEGKALLSDLAGLKAPEPWKAEYGKTDDALLAYSNRLITAWSKEYKRLQETYGSANIPTELQPTWARAAKAIKSNLSTPLDQIANGTQRKQVEAVGQRAREILSERGIDVTTADLQALLWYPEKELWGGLRDKLEVDEDGIPVVTANSLNESYDTTFARIFRSQGYEVEGIEGDGAGGSGQGAVSGQDAGSVGPEGTAGTGQAAADIGSRGGGPLEQQLDSGARGSIEGARPTDVQDIVIRLYKAENLSTFLHESGHLYLKMLGTLASDATAPQQVKDDFAGVLKFLDVKSEGEIGTAQHEKWAETYEQYLRDGKAPSQELRSAFSKFSAWLTTLYRSIKSIGTGRAALNKDIAGVMDRLLATDEQIANVQSEMRMAPMFKDAEAAGMTDEAFAEYKQRYEDARDAAREELVQEAFAETRRERTKWWREQLKAETARVLEGMDTDPAWRTRAIIQAGVLPSGAPLPEVYPPRMKLNKAATAEYGHDLPGGNQLFARDGVSPDRAAQDLGYETGDQMLYELSQLPKDENGRFLTAKQFADQQAQEYMLQEHGDIMNPDEMHEEALMKVHSRRQAQVILDELRLLNRKAGGRDSVTNAAARNAAEQAMSEKTISEIESPTKYLNAERRFSMKAAEAVIAGDIDAALRFKTQQLLNFHMYRTARDMRMKADKMIATLNKRSRQKMDPKRVEPSFITQIKGMVSGIDFSSRMSQDRQASLSAETLQNWADQQSLKYGATFHISPALDRALSKMNVRDFTFSELEGLHDTVKSVYTQGLRYADAQNAQFNSIVQNMGYDIDANAKKKVPLRTGQRTKWEGAKSFVRLAFAEHRHILSLSEELDGYEQNGSVYSNVYQPIKRADDRYIDRSMKAAQTLNKILRRYTKSERLGFLSKKYIPELEGTTNPNLSRNERLAFGLNMGNAGNVSVMKDTYSDKQIDAVMATLTDKDWDVIESIWEHVDSYWDELSSLEERTTGVKPAKVDPSPFELPSGRKIKGGYYPLMADPNADRNSKEQYMSSQSLQSFSAGGKTKVSTKHGSTIERQGFGERPVWLDLRGLFEHIDGVVKDIEMREAVADVSRIIRSKPFEQAVKDAKGFEFYEMFNNWLENTVGSSKPPITTVEKISQYARTGASIAEMGLSVRTVLMQPFGFTNSVALLGEKYAAKGLAEFIGQRGGSVRKVMEASAFMRNRSATFNRDVREANRWMGVDSLKQDVVNASFWGIQKLDMAVSIPTWLGAYQKSIDEGRSHDDAVDFADQTVSRGQGTGLPRDMADIQQGPVWKKMFTMFYSYFGAYQNMQTDQWKQTNFKNPAQAMKYAKNQMWITIIPSIAVDALFNQLFSGDDDEMLWAKIGGSIMKTLFGGIVFVRDVANLVASGFKFDYQLTPAGNPIKEAGNLAKQIGQGEIDTPLIKSLIMTAGYMGQIPGARQASRAYSVVADEDTPFEIDEFESWYRVLVTGPKRN